MKRLMNSQLADGARTKRDLKVTMLGWALAAGLAGLALAMLPVMPAAILLLAVALVGLTLIDPLIGVGVALVLGPSKPLTDYFVPALPLDLGQIALIVTLGAYLLHAAANHRIVIPKSPFNLALVVFVGVAGGSLLNALSLGNGITEVAKWLQLVVMMWLIIDLAGEKRLWVVAGFLVAAAALQAVIGVWQFGLRGDGPEHFQILGGRFYRAYGSFEQPNPYAGFIGLMLPLTIGLSLAFLARWANPVIDRWIIHRQSARLRLWLGSLFSRELVSLLFMSALSILLLSALIMSWSRGAWLGFAGAAAVIVLAWPRNVWIGFGLVLASTLLGIVVLESGLAPAAIAARLTDFGDMVRVFDVRGVDINDVNYSVLERLAHWQAAQEMARHHFWIGVGIGNYEVVYPGYALLNWPQALGHAHNIYLNMFAETGIIGLTAYSTLWGVIFWQTWQAIRRSTNPDYRYLAIGLLGAWTHLSIHNGLDKLYVANIHLHVGAMIGLLSVLAVVCNQEKEAIE